METKLERISQLSSENPNMVFTSVGHLINKELLMECHKDMDGKKGTGIDGVTKEDYGVKLEENLENLVKATETEGIQTQTGKESRNSEKNVSFALSLNSIGCSTFLVHTYILTLNIQKRVQEYM